MIDEYGVRPDPAKVTAVVDWPTPSGVRDIQSFLGLANYFHQLIRGCASLAMPLTTLLQKGLVFVWGEAQEHAFSRLKDALVTAPVLFLPDRSRNYTIETDALGTAIGGTLEQDYGRGLQPIAYFSHKMILAKCHYAVHERSSLQRDASNLSCSQALEIILGWKISNCVDRSQSLVEYQDSA